MSTPAASAASKPTIAQFLSPASALELTAARKADRVAWVAYERGMRNVYTAAAPDFRPVRVTAFTKDDGAEVSDVTHDTRSVTFDGTHPDPESFTVGADQPRPKEPLGCTITVDGKVVSSRTSTSPTLAFVYCAVRTTF
jgi:hypothetical protein